MEGIIYHASPIGGLKVLEPHLSSHGKSYVYGTKNLNLALFFGSPKTMRDLDGNYGTKRLSKNSKEIPYFYEAYQGALERRFKGVSCYLYEVDPTDFEESKTSFKAEVVSEKPVKVLKCIKIDDIYEILLKAKEKGDVELNMYSLDEEYQKHIQNHIKSRLQFIVNYKNCKEYEFCKEKFPELLKQVEEEMAKQEKYETKE